jgi:regulator of protease activity HflC (stomatin/prohibitin superfamily)
VAAFLIVLRLMKRVVEVVAVDVEIVHVSPPPPVLLAKRMRMRRKRRRKRGRSRLMIEASHGEQMMGALHRASRLST